MNQTTGWPSTRRVRWRGRERVRRGDVSGTPRGAWPPREVTGGRREGTRRRTGYHLTPLRGADLPREVTLGAVCLGSEQFRVKLVERIECQLCAHHFGRRRLETEAAKAGD
jgi:hypothetical protein